MRGFELVKREDHWALYNEDGHKIAATLPGCNSKLSLENCEAIANGYDLDELTNRAFDNMGYHSTVTPHEEKQFKLGYRVAFREALELLGDKKFSEEDIKKAFNVGWIQRHNEEGSHYEVMGKVIQSLQQTEFDVEVEMTEDWYDGFKSKPKLDKDGCLILRRK